MGGQERTTNSRGLLAALLQPLWGSHPFVLVTPSWHGAQVKSVLLGEE